LSGDLALLRLAAGAELGQLEVEEYLAEFG
jgi:hypothetical protein